MLIELNRVSLAIHESAWRVKRWWMLELILLFSQEIRAFPAPYQGYFFDPEHIFGFYEGKTTAAT